MAISDGLSTVTKKIVARNLIKDLAKQSDKLLRIWRWSAEKRNAHTPFDPLLITAIREEFKTLFAEELKKWK